MSSVIVSSTATASNTTASTQYVTVGDNRYAYRQFGKTYADLKKITQPVLVTNGNNDIMIPTVNSLTLTAHLPNVQLIIYPDSGHGSLFQHASAYTSHVSEFLNRRDALVVQNGMKCR